MDFLFVIVVLLIAYAAYSNLDRGGEVKSSAPPVAPKPAPAPAPSKVAAEAVKPAPVQVAEKAPEVKPAEPAPEPVAAESAAAVTSLRDPKTGEVSPVPANYRFAKRWIKDALVAEGLLDKVYKNNDLDEASSAKVKQAMDALKAMSKYQG